MVNRRKVLIGDIEILSLIKSLKKNKFIYLFSIVSSILLASIYLNFIKSKYETEIEYNLNINSNFLDILDINNDFINSIYSNLYFQEWKKDNQDSLLTFEDIAPYQKINDFYFKKINETLLIDVIHSKTNDFKNTLIIRTGDLILIEDIFNYINFLNVSFSKDYLFKIKNEINNYFLLNEIFLKKNEPNQINTFDNSSKSLEFFYNNDTKIFNFSYPSLPKKIFPNTNLIIILSIFFGIFSGFIISFFRDIYLLNLKIINKNFTK